MHLPSSPESLLLGCDDSLLDEVSLDSGAVSLLLDAGCSLELISCTDEDDCNTTEDDDPDSEEVCAELDKSTSAELATTEELETNELSLEGVADALVDESSPQATMPAPTKTLKQKTRATFLIYCNIKKETPALQPG